MKVSGASDKKGATGGHGGAGELYQINERGVEMFRPAMNGHILSARQTQQAGSSSITVNIDGRRVGVDARLEQAVRTIVSVVEDTPNLRKAGY